MRKSWMAWAGAALALALGVGTAEARSPEACDRLAGPQTAQLDAAGAAEAARACEAAATAQPGVARFHLQLARALRALPDNRNPRARAEQILDAFRAAAAAGDASAQTSYGYMLLQGEVFHATPSVPIPAQPEEGERWLLAAAEAGESLAMGILAFHYGPGGRLGSWDDASRRRSAEWRVRAAEAGDSASIPHAAEALLIGVHVARDDARARRLLTPGPDAPYISSTYPIMLARGIGGPAEPAEAERLARLEACDCPEVLAQLLRLQGRLAETEAVLAADTGGDLDRLPVEDLGLEARQLLLAQGRRLEEMAAEYERDGYRIVEAYEAQWAGDLYARLNEPAAARREWRLALLLDGACGDLLGCRLPDRDAVASRLQSSASAEAARPAHAAYARAMQRFVSLDGRVARRDAAVARDLAEAADAGHVLAAEMLVAGVVSATGLGRSDWREAAVRAGAPLETGELGLELLTGRDVARQPERGRALVLSALAQGERRFVRDAGRIHLFGLGGPQDLAEAERLLTDPRCACPEDQVRLRLAQGRFDEAERALRALDQDEPPGGPMWVRLALARGQAEQALAWMPDQPLYADGRLLSGDVLAALGRTQEARAAWEAALAVEGQCLEIGLSDCALADGETVRARLATLPPGD